MGKTFQTVAAIACMKSLLMAFNFIFWVSGLAMLAIGVWMEIELYKYMELSTEFSGTAPYVLIGVGVVIVIVGSFACCCTVKGQPVLLYVYGAFLAVILVVELGAGISIYAYRTKLSEGFDKGLNQSLVDYPFDSAGKKANIDVIQENLNCCGNHQYTDWASLHMPIPTSCCIEPNCNTSINSEIFIVGCYDKVVDLLNSNIGIVAGAAIGIAFFPIVGIILSCCLASTANKAKYEQMA